MTKQIVSNRARGQAADLADAIGLKDKAAIKAIAKALSEKHAAEKQR